MKITIAVAINEDTDWYAWGSSQNTLKQARAEVAGQVNYPSVVHYIEVDIPVPTPQTFEGKIICSTPSILDS
jgi:hypothetical protein